jgi:hypothetical protein
VKVAQLNNVQQQQQQQQQHQRSQQQQLAGAKAASPPVPRLQLQKLRNMDLGRVDTSASASNKVSSRPGALSASTAQPQQLHLHQQVWHLCRPGVVR